MKNVSMSGYRRTETYWAPEIFSANNAIKENHQSSTSANYFLRYTRYKMKITMKIASDTFACAYMFTYCTCCFVSKLPSERLNRHSSSVYWNGRRCQQWSGAGNRASIQIAWILWVASIYHSFFHFFQFKILNILQFKSPVATSRPSFIFCAVITSCTTTW